MTQLTRINFVIKWNDQLCFLSVNDLWSHCADNLSCLVGVRNIVISILSHREAGFTMAYSIWFYTCWCRLLRELIFGSRCFPFVLFTLDCEILEPTGRARRTDSWDKPTTVLQLQQSGNTDMPVDCCNIKQTLHITTVELKIFPWALA